MSAEALPELKVETPERVELSLEVAGMGTRALAYLVDALLMFLFWTTVSFLASFVIELSPDFFASLASTVQAGVVFGIFLVQWGYWVTFETLWSGQSPGKRALQIRVVKLDGSPVTFVENALRSLGRVADFLPALYATGLLTMAIHPRSRRLGDLLAGTLVVRERKIDLSRYDAPELKPVIALGALALTAEEFELVASYLSRAGSLTPEARARVAVKVAEPFVKRLTEEKRGDALKSGPHAEAFLKGLVGRDG